VTVLGALGFENAYTLAMRGERAGALGVRTIADLTPLAPRLALGSDLEFLSRPEWAALRNAYGLAFGEEKSFNPTFMNRAIQDGLADVISAFSSDGRLAGDALVTLEDDVRWRLAPPARLPMQPSSTGVCAILLKQKSRQMDVPSVQLEIASGPINKWDLPSGEVTLQSWVADRSLRWSGGARG
jgi:hypothetical protein